MPINRVFMAILFLALSCAPSMAATQNGWTAAKVIGLQLKLIDSNRIEEYSFTRNYVIPTVSSHDIVVNPLWRWKIREGHLQIFSESKLENEFTLIGMNAKTITVRRDNGLIAQFRYSYRR